MKRIVDKIKIDEDCTVRDFIKALMEVTYDLDSAICVSKPSDEEGTSITHLESDSDCVFIMF